MKILHTSDWHLGQKFLYKDRQEEHQAALDWLRDCIIQEQVEMLIIAGDIFDISNPPNYARRMYYNFLTGLIRTQCRHIVIIGGNHDSPTMLEAPKALLESLNVYVLGAAPEQLEEELLVLKGPDGEPEVIVAAVPFLRDRDLRTSVAVETGAERIEQIKQGIKTHYQKIGELAANYTNLSIPFLVTGHLYASGAETSGKQDNIYIGDQENIPAADFPKVFDYVALGHIHRQQAVGGLEHIRYSGSLIPLSFSETKDEKGVIILTFEGKQLQSPQFQPAPEFRRLKTIRGDLDAVIQKIKHYVEERDYQLPPWLEVTVEAEGSIPRLDLQLQELVADSPVEILKIKLDRSRHLAIEERPLVELEDLEVLDVFQQKCAQLGHSAEEQEELEGTFRELLNWMEENEEF